MRQILNTADLYIGKLVKMTRDNNIFYCIVSNVQEGKNKNSKKITFKIFNQITNSHIGNIIKKSDTNTLVLDTLSETENSFVSLTDKNFKVKIFETTKEEIESFIAQERAQVEQEITMTYTQAMKNSTRVFENRFEAVQTSVKSEQVVLQ